MVVVVGGAPLRAAPSAAAASLALAVPASFAAPGREKRRRGEVWPPSPRSKMAEAGPGGREAAATPRRRAPTAPSGQRGWGGPGAAPKRRELGGRSLQAPPSQAQGGRSCSWLRSPLPGAPGPRTRHLRGAGRARQRLGATCRSPAPAAPGRPPRFMNIYSERRRAPPRPPRPPITRRREGGRLRAPLRWSGAVGLVVFFIILFLFFLFLFNFWCAFRAARLELGWVQARGSRSPGVPRSCAHTHTHTRGQRGFAAPLFSRRWGKNVKF